MKFLVPDHPLLTKIAEEIPLREIKSRQTRDIIEGMLRLAYGEQEDNKRPIMVGLAAPQIGISKRIILVDIAADGKGDVGDIRLYLNPKIIFLSQETNEWYEGCYSTGIVCGIVNRPTKIKIKASNNKGRIIEEEYEGYTARIFQHEIDHLNGKVFVDHITNDDYLHKVEKKEFPLYRNNEGWRNWPKKITREEWLRIKGLL